MQQTLVLSNSFQPVSRVDWKRAITLLFADKVEVVSVYEDQVVRSVSLQLKMPSVVRFLRGAHFRRRGVKFSRENVYARDKRRCQYCGVIVARPDATYDHVMPRSRGGRTCWENIVIACLACNQHKAGRTPAEARMKLLSTPRKPERLPDTLELFSTWDKGNIPDAWRTWLRDYSYWNGALEEDK
jgi:5-methylcytosine-specific restriction endonuclease McrA